MKLIINAGIVAVAFSLTGCVSSEISELDARVSALEKNPPVLDDITQSVLDIAIGGPSSHLNKPDKQNAVLALALFKRTETIPEIIRLAKASQDRHFRMECNNALGWFGDEQAIPYLKDSMKNDSYRFTRRAAAVALESITGEKYVTPENGFESKEMIADRLKKQSIETKRIQENLANQKPQPTPLNTDDKIKTQDGAAEL